MAVEMTPETHSRTRPTLIRACVRPSGCVRCPQEARTKGLKSADPTQIEPGTRSSFLLLNWGMKTALHAATLMVTQLLFTAPIQARDMTRWVDISCYANRCESVKIVSPVFFLHRSSEGDVWTVEADCKRGRTRAVFKDGSKARWFYPPSGSTGRGMLKQVCR